MMTQNQHPQEKPVQSITITKEQLINWHLAEGKKAQDRVKTLEQENYTLRNENEDLYFKLMVCCAIIGATILCFVVPMLMTTFKIFDL